MKKRLVGVLLAVALVGIGLATHPAQVVHGTVVAPNWGPYYRTDLAPYSAACSTGAGTDVSAAVNSAITDANGFGRGTVIVPPCQTTTGNEAWGSPAGAFYGLSHSLIPKSFVTLDLTGAYFKWIGTTTANWMMQNVQAANVPLLYFDLRGGEFDAVSTANINGIQLDAWQHGHLTGTVVRNTNGGGRNAYQVGVLISSVNGTTWLNNSVSDQIEDLHIDSANQGLEFLSNCNGAGPTNTNIIGLHVEDVTRSAINISGCIDDLRFFDYSLGSSALPGGLGQANDGSWWIGVNLAWSAVTSPTNNIDFVSGSISNGCPIAGLNDTAINFGGAGAAKSSGIEFQSLYLGGCAYSSNFTNTGSATSYWVEVVDDTTLADGTQTIKVYKKGYTP